MYLSNDLLQYVLNPYLEHDNLDYLGSIFNFKFDKSIHVKIEEFRYSSSQNDKSKTIYITIDGVYRKQEKYYKNGIKEYEEFHENNDSEIKWISYSETGSKLDETNYKKYKKEDEEKEYIVKEGKQYEWYETGKLYKTENYKDDKKDGEQYEWYPNKNMKSKENYKDGKYDKLQYNYFENGELSYLSNYKDGETDGTQYSWYINKQLSTFQNYKNGKKDGIQYEYEMDGKLIDVRYYDNGILEKREFYKDGILEETKYHKFFPAGKNGIK